MKAEYNTRQRATILEILKENSAHLSARDIIERLKSRGEKIGPATVYRTLDRLCEQGVIKKFVIDERSGACYQYAELGDCENHFHLKCVSCGTLFHLDCNFVADMEKHFFEDHGFTVSSGKTVIYGTCSACSGKGEGGVVSHHSCCSHKH